LSVELDNYFKENLQRLTKGDKNRMIVIYCLADCWMSWNAAKRAAMEYGYMNTYWYPDGTTGWEAAELPLENSQPIAME
ncbi:MAG: rhodanese-like domain-containing protein, partial [Candidatus Thiodiazotropha sp.]